MFYKTSKVWILDFTYDGAPRRWFKALLEDADARTLFEAQRGDLYGKRGRFVDVRPATRDEETQYLNGTAPKNVGGFNPEVQPLDCATVTGG